MRAKRLAISTGVALAVLLAVTLAALALAGHVQRDDPRSKLPAVPAHTSHAAMINEKFDSPQAVTRACLRCHPQTAAEVMATSHWTWESDTVVLPEGRGELRVGKKNMVNNYCIGVQGNEGRCMTCHIGYGWKDSSFDFSNQDNIDCLICHDTSGGYRKEPDGAGMPAKDVDLMACAKSAGRPNRHNCGVCHFAGGGGDAVKHGDMDSTMYYPNSRIDAHMGKYDMQCQDCHQTQQHQIKGRLLSVSSREEFDVACTDCHSSTPHAQERLNQHTQAVSCQACHIPRFAIEEATKMNWDWSEAGQDRPGADAHEYDKKKGSFIYESNVVPEYLWYNGAVQHYLPGEKFDPAQVLQLNPPTSSISDPRAKLWPFKVHRGKQIYDAGFNYLMTPVTYGQGGYWTNFDWDQALRLSTKHSGLPYSGKYGFVATEMFWPITHMVTVKEKALQCTDCHGQQGRLDWQKLGYPGDPLVAGGRVKAGLLEREEVAQ